jgi:hypothetical protein
VDGCIYGFRSTGLAAGANVKASDPAADSTANPHTLTLGVSRQRSVIPASNLLTERTATCLLIQEELYKRIKDLTAQKSGYPRRSIHNALTVLRPPFEVFDSRTDK